MKIHFETNVEEDSSVFTKQEYYEKIDKSIRQAETGQTQKLTKERQKNLLGL